MTVALRPMAASQKYSKVVNLKAISASRGAEVMRMMAPINPPMAEKTTSTPKTNSPLPCLVSSKESCVYAAEEGVPGMRTKAAGMSPAKMAMADMVTMETSAGTGSMKKVKGMRRDAARVALKPGMEPPNKPKR